jgi:predicted enzyme related to lactoylglutathione lyase
MDNTAANETGKLEQITEVCHIEWECSEHARTQRFYEEVFGWKFSEGHGELIFCSTAKGHLGAFVRVAAPKPATSTVVYFTVSEIEPYVAAALRCGGAVHAAKHPVPSVGWSAQISDPDGNVLGLVQFE